METDYINLTKKQEEVYTKLAKAIGEKGMLLIHLKHHKEFIVSLDKIKKDAQKELLEELAKFCEDKELVIDETYLRYKLKQIK